MICDDELMRFKEAGRVLAQYGPPLSTDGNDDFQCCLGLYPEHEENCPWLKAAKVFAE